MRGKGRLSRFDLVNDECENDMYKHIDKRAMPRMLEHEFVLQIIEHGFD